MTGKKEPHAGHAELSKGRIRKERSWSIVVGLSLKADESATRKFPRIWFRRDQLIAEVHVLKRLFGRPLDPFDVYLFVIRHLPSVVSRTHM